MKILPVCPNPDALAEPLYQQLLSDYSEPLPPLPAKHRLFYDPADPNQHSRYTAMSCMADGVGLTKVIAAFDERRSVTATGVLIDEQGQTFILDYTGLNVVRTAVSAIVALKMGKIDASRPLGLIGTGRINRLVLRYASRFLGVREVVALNRSGGYAGIETEADNAGVELFCGAAALHMVDSVVACTTNDDPGAMLTERQLPNVRLAVALDGGNTLAGKFRKTLAFADVPHHWDEVAGDEFWDGGERPAEWLPLSHPALGDNPAVVWLLGNALADLRIAQVYLKGLQS